MRHQHRLRTLKVRVRRHGICARRFRLLHESRRELCQQFCDLVDLLAHIQPQVSRNLLVATSTGMELESHLAGNLDQSMLDVVMHVFDRRVVSFRNTLTRDLIQHGEGCR